eukprot:1811570-Pyramimonas_sp.AAC.1
MFPAWVVTEAVIRLHAWAGQVWPARRGPIVASGAGLRSSLRARAVVLGPAVFGAAPRVVTLA